MMPILSVICPLENRQNHLAMNALAQIQVVAILPGGLYVLQHAIGFAEHCIYADEVEPVKAPAPDELQRPYRRGEAEVPMVYRDHLRDAEILRDMLACDVMGNQQ